VYTQKHNSMDPVNWPLTIKKSRSQVTKTISGYIVRFVKVILPKKWFLLPFSYNLHFQL